jgi:hypothetical protein
MSMSRSTRLPLRPLLGLLAILLSLGLMSACGGDDAPGSAGGTTGGEGDILQDAALGRDIGVSIRDTGLALTGLGGCGRRLSCYRAEGAEISRFAAAERARLAPRVARAETGCVRDTGELQLDLLEFLGRAGTELERADYQGVIRSSAALARRVDDVTAVGRDCAQVVIP